MASPIRARRARVILAGLLAAASVACTQCREDETYVSVRDVWGNATGEHVCVAQQAGGEASTSSARDEGPPAPRFIDTPAARDAGRAGDTSPAPRAGTCSPRHPGALDVVVVRRTGTLIQEQADGGGAAAVPDGDYVLVQATAYERETDAFGVRGLRVRARVTGGLVEMSARVVRGQAPPVDESLALLLRDGEGTLVCSSPDAVLAALLLPNGAGRPSEGTMAWVEGTGTLQLVVRSARADVELFLVPA